MGLFLLIRNYLKTRFGPFYALQHEVYILSTSLKYIKPHD